MKGSAPVFWIGLLAMVLLGVGGWFLFAGPVNGLAMFGMDHGPTGFYPDSSADPADRAGAARPPGTVVIEGFAGSPFITGEVIAELEAMEGVRDVKPLLAIEAFDGTKVFGVEVNGPLQLPTNGALVNVGILEGGRGFNANEAEQPVMLVGRTFAETHDTPFGYKILGMVGEDHKPFYFLGESQLVIQGIYETGDASTDAGIVLPLAVAQQLTGLEGKASSLYVTASANSEDAVEKALEDSVADEARIIVRE